MGSSGGDGIEQLLACLLDRGQDRATQHRAFSHGCRRDPRIAQADLADPGRDALGKRHAARVAHATADHHELRVEDGADGGQPESRAAGKFVDERDATAVPAVQNGDRSAHTRIRRARPEPGTLGKLAYRGGADQ